jgi:hypothetical protein
MVVRMLEWPVRGFSFHVLVVLIIDMASRVLMFNSLLVHLWAPWDDHTIQRFFQAPTAAI